MWRVCLVILTALSLLGLSLGCAFRRGPDLVPPSQLEAPSPRMDNEGSILSPYTSDGTVTKWCGMAREARLGAGFGSFIGGTAASYAAGQVPLIGGFLAPAAGAVGSSAGEKLGRDAAIDACGGMQAIKETSDLSFNSVNDLILWMYVHHSDDPEYEDVRHAAGEIYPELVDNYLKVLVAASQRHRAQNGNK